MRYSISRLIELDGRRATSF